MKRPRCVTVLSSVYVFLLIGTPIAAAAADNPFLGHWALTIPGGGPGWLGIEERDGTLQGSILWGGGSVLPVASVAREGDTLVVTRVFESRRKKAASSEGATREVETIRASLDGDTMNLTVERQRGAGKPSGKTAFTGKRIPPVPPAPDLGKVKFAEPIKLFNGADLNGWSVVNRGPPSGWRVEDGVLINDAKQEPGERKSLRQHSHGPGVRGLQLDAGNARPRGGQQRHLLAGHLRSTSGRHLRPGSRLPQHGRRLQPHHAHGVCRKTRRPVADVGHYAGGPPRHRGAERSEDH